MELIIIAFLIGIGRIAFLVCIGRIAFLVCIGRTFLVCIGRIAFLVCIGIIAFLICIDFAFFVCIVLFLVFNVERFMPKHPRNSKFHFPTGTRFYPFGGEALTILNEYGLDEDFAKGAWSEV